MKIGSICSGYGGLDMATEQYFNAETVWMADLDKYSSLVIEQRWKLPNLGDIKQVDWKSVESIDILTAGYPCQPFSNAGQRKGEKDERHLWPHIKEIISQIRPRIVFLENVRGHLTLGFKEVLKGLAELGYDAKWTIVRASDVGAPHQRARLFIIAYSDSQTFEQSRRTNRAISEQTIEVIDRSDREINGGGTQTLQCSDSDCLGQPLGKDYSGKIRNQEQSQSQSASLGKISSNSDNQQLSSNRKVSKLGRRFDSRLEMSMRSIPDPLVDGKLNVKYVEYMMGLPEGWVTDLDISRAQKFKLLGNGVVPQQAFEALNRLFNENT